MIQILTRSKVIFECNDYFKIQIFLQLISISGRDNSSLTISKWPFLAAQTNGVQLNHQLQYQKKFK